MGPPPSGGPSVWSRLGLKPLVFIGLVTLREQDWWFFDILLNPFCMRLNRDIQVLSLSLSLSVSSLHPLLEWCYSITLSDSTLSLLCGICKLRNSIPSCLPKNRRNLKGKQSDTDRIWALQLMPSWVTTQSGSRSKFLMSFNRYHPPLRGGWAPFSMDWPIIQCAKKSRTVDIWYITQCGLGVLPITHSQYRRVFLKPHPPENARSLAWPKFDENYLKSSPYLRFVLNKFWTLDESGWWLIIQSILGSSQWMENPIYISVDRMIII